MYIYIYIYILEREGGFRLVQILTIENCDSDVYVYNNTQGNIVNAITNMRKRPEDKHDLR